MSDARGDRRALVALLVAGTALLAWALPQGWYPHDEGALGQSAERLLGGEWPHRDFDEIYTLLLSAWHALWFALLGPAAWVTRVALGLAALPWLYAMFRIGRRFLPPMPAAGLALLGLLWSLPNYPAGMPSWYLLFCATWAALCVLKWQEQGSAGWLFVAGALGGVAVGFKLSGVLVVAGVGLALVTQALTARDPGDSGIPRRLVGAALALAGLAFIAAVGRGGRELLRYGVPVGAMLLALGVRAWRDSGARPRVAMRDFTPLVILLGGAAVPVLAIALLYAALGGLPTLIDGVLIAPFKRVAFASHSPPSPEVLQLALPLLALLALPSARAKWSGPVLRLGVLGMLATLALSSGEIVLYRIGWYSAWSLLFAIVGLSVWTLWRSDEAERDVTDASPDDRRALALSAIAVGLALVEYPFAAPIYVLYSLPLVFIAAAAWQHRLTWTDPRLRAAVLVFFLAFGAFRVIPGSFSYMGTFYVPSRDLSALTLPRARLQVTLSDSVTYEALIPFVQQVAAGRRVWAGPDAPEVYFLGGFRNETRTLFDFFDADSVAAVPLPTRLQRLGVDVVVVKTAPPFSPRLPEEHLAAIAASFPNVRTIGGFEVYWR